MQRGKSLAYAANQRAVSSFAGGKVVAASGNETLRPAEPRPAAALARARDR